MTPDSGTNTTLETALATTPVGVQLQGDIPDNAEIALDFEMQGEIPDPTPAPTPAPTPEPSTTKPTPEPTPAPEKPADPTFELPDEPEPEPEPAPTAQQPSALPPQRDYSAYPADLHPVLRQLNNKAFAEFGPRLKEAYEARQKAAELEAKVAQKPNFFYEHPDAYRLDPDYNKLASSFREVQFEEQHWSEQLQRIKSGQAWKSLEGYNNKDGRPIFRDIPAPEDGTVDARAEVEVLRLMTETTQAKAMVGRELNNFANQYQSRRQQANAELAEVKSKLFPKLTPENLTGIDKQNYELAASITPQALRNHPLAQLNQLAFVAYHRLQRAYAEVVNENKRLKSRAPVPATPAPSATQGGAPAGDDVQIPLDVDDL